MNTGHHRDFHFFQTVEYGVTFADVGNHFLCGSHSFQFINIRSDNKVVFFAARNHHPLDALIIFYIIQDTGHFIQQAR